MNLRTKLSLTWKLDLNRKSLKTYFGINICNCFRVKIIQHNERNCIFINLLYRLSIYKMDKNLKKQQIDIWKRALHVI